MNAKLDLNNIPKLVGEKPKEKLEECFKLIDNTRYPLYFVGPSGSGKSIMAMNLAKKYSEEKSVPAYYVQLSPEQTKTSLILGLRLIDGSLKAHKGVVAECMENGGIIVIDEATHTTQEMLLMFNSILDRTSITSIGDEIVYAKESFRIIFCSNDSSYAGNIRLPQSFAQRLVTFYFDYPTFEDECKIVNRIAKDECNIDFKMSANIIKYVTSLLRDLRTKDFPLSARNGSIATIRLALATKKEVNKPDPYFTVNSNVESIRKKIAIRIFNNVDNIGIAQIASKEVNAFIDYISSVGIQEFKDIIFSSFMYFLDVDGSELMNDKIKNNIQSSII
jgi:MoxR-like ATPase